MPHFDVEHPRSACGAPPLAGGDTSGLAKPVPRCLLEGVLLLCQALCLVGDTVLAVEAV